MRINIESTRVKSNMMNEEYIKQLLRKLIDTTAVLQPQELNYLKNLFDSCEGRVYVESIMQEAWQHNSAEEDSVNFDKLYVKIETLLKKRRGNRRMLLRLQRVAAVLFIPVMLSVYLLTKMPAERPLSFVDLETVGPFEHEYYVPAGTKSIITLSDSSRIWLNANSRLIVEGNFGKETRRVRLLGEAYFEVRKNKDIPFEVSANDMDVRVLGTMFNLSAYPDNTFVEAVLVEGEIEVGTSRYFLKNVQKTRMKPLQRLALNKTDHKLTVEDNVATELYTAWKDNRLVYENTSMSEVAKTLERWFNVSFLIRDSELNSYAYTGKFEDRSLEQILHFIQLSSPIAFQIKRDTVTLTLKYKP